MHTTTRTRFGLGVLAISLASAVTGCAAAADDSEDPSTTSDHLYVDNASARCEGGDASFTLVRASLDYGNSQRPARYRLRDVTVHGVSYTGTFSEDRSPLGDMFRAEFWNGIPLSGNRFVTDSRMHAAKARPDGSMRDFGTQDMSFRARVRCQVELGPNASFSDRFRLTYENDVTKIYPERRNPNFHRINAPALSSIPAILQPSATASPSALTTFELDGTRVYSLSRRGSIVFFDAAGSKFASGWWGPQMLPDHPNFSSEEWESLPKNIWRWGLDI